jgi:AcrR family transcriptional regulator
MRADAARNRRRLLDAASRTVMELGPDAPLEAIARRAEVGIATLYRHFGDRTMLLRAVAADVAEAAERAAAALEEASDGFTALRRFMHAMLDGAVPALMPWMAPEIRDAPEVRERLDAIAEVQTRLIERAKREGTLRDDVEFADIGFALMRFARPIGGQFDPAAEAAIAHRHLEVFIRGLHTGGDTEFPGPALTLDELRAMGSN